MQEIVKEHGRTAAARARANLSALLNWAMREGLCESNPTIGTNNPNEGAQSRDRVLTDRELAVVWNACGDDDFGRIVRLLILTGCRREEIGGLQWREIDLATGMIAIPGERTKNLGLMRWAWRTWRWKSCGQRHDARTGILFSGTEADRLALGLTQPSR